MYIKFIPKVIFSKRNNLNYANIVNSEVCLIALLLVLIINNDQIMSDMYSLVHFLKILSLYI